MMVAAVAVLAGVLSAALVAEPAAAAPPLTLTPEQVQYWTINRTNPVPGEWFRGSYVELRAGWYNGYQYGWARLAPEATNWGEGDSLVLQINAGDGRGWQWGPVMAYGNGWGHTGGAITYADPDYQFRACLFAGGDYKCTLPW